MARLMSVAYTEEQVRARIKHVTRRAGWEFAKVGDRLILCRKVMGRRGAPLVRIVPVELLDVRRERLDMMIVRPSYGEAEVALEGFPHMEPSAFVAKFFTEAQGIFPDEDVTRLEWKYLPTACHRCALETTVGWRTTPEWDETRFCSTCWLAEKRAS